MKVFYINSVPYGSTGRIMFRLADEVKKIGGETLCTTGFTWRKFDRDDYFITSGIVGKKLHTEFSKITGKHGGYSRFSTLRLILKIKKFNPDIIHLHNIHGWFLNYEMLFRYLKKSKKKIVWTFHDCWNFTGRCPYFDILECEKWKKGCHNCLYKGYPKTFFDCSKTQFKRKKQLFCGIESLYIVTPSQWLKTKVEESFLNNYPVSVINNGIDLSVFNPKNNTEEIRRKYGIKSKYMVLGVSYAWDKRKGLDTFIKLSSELGDDYTMVLVGTDKSVRVLLPENIISVDITSSAEELAELYSAADVFANPTLEENFPTVNIESLACGTPIVSFNTGGSPEIFCEKSGISVEKGDVESFKNAIIDVCEKSLFSSENCVSRSKQFDESLFAKRYMELYQKIL